MLNNQSYLQDFGLLTELTSEESAAISGGAKVSETIGGGVGVAIGTTFGGAIGGVIGGAIGTSVGGAIGDAVETVGGWLSSLVDRL